MLREVFLNPGIYLLFGAIVVGFVSRKQGVEVTRPDDELLLDLFQGALCFFLLEMGISAASKLKDLRTSGWRFIAFALIAPNVFAGLGILVAHGYSHFTGLPLELGPEASPTLPLAASLGVTFSYNVTIGIPLYIQIAKTLTTYFPVI